MNENEYHLKLASLKLEVSDLESKRDMLKRMVLSFSMERMKSYQIAVENSYSKILDLYNDNK
jgi:hypothetical protein